MSIKSKISELSDKRFDIYEVAFVGRFANENGVSGVELRPRSGQVHIETR
jgi:hypothetical protein